MDFMIYYIVWYCAGIMQLISVKGSRIVKVLDILIRNIILEK